MCWVTRIGGIFSGSRVKISWSAWVPPVEEPMMMRNF
jgi:hypothetical protein